MRDPSKSPHEPVADEWTSPKGRKYTYTSFVIHGEFKIPVEDFTSVEEETVYIIDMCKEIGRGVLYIMQQDYFKPMYETAIGKPGVWAAIADPDNVNKQYWTYAKNAAVRVSKCDSLNKHLILTAATDLVGKLYESNQATVKYATEDPSKNDGSDDNNSENSEDEDEGSNGSCYVPPVPAVAQVTTAAVTRSKDRKKKGPKIAKERPSTTRKRSPTIYPR